jgi:ribosomal protein L7Ae-like RNA K-turn-binding protein
MAVETLEGLIRERAFRKVVSLLGLARRARKVVSGAEAVELAVRRRTARLVLIALDASARSVAKFRVLVAEKGGLCHQGMGKEELGAAVGGAPRAVLAITDENFARAVMSALMKIPSGGEAGADSEGEAKDRQAPPRKAWR